MRGNALSADRAFPIGIHRRPKKKAKIAMWGAAMESFVCERETFCVLLGREYSHPPLHLTESRPLTAAGVSHR